MIAFYHLIQKITVEEYKDSKTQDCNFVSCLSGCQSCLWY